MQLNFAPAIEAGTGPPEVAVTVAMATAWGIFAGAIEMQYAPKACAV
jgi:hypothetical protein